MKRYRLIILMCLIIVIPIGWFSKFYSGPFDGWINDSVSSIFYEMFWVWLVVLIWPHLSPISVGVGVFLVTSILEFLQLWNPPILAMMRSHIIGKLLLGTTFDWWDFLYYAIGCILAALVLITVRNKIGLPNHQ